MFTTLWYISSETYILTNAPTDPVFLQCVYISIRDDICTHLPFYTLYVLHFNQCTNRPCFLQCVYISIRDDICTHLPFYTLYVFLHGKIAPNALFCYWVLMMATSSSSSINAIFFTYWVSCQIQIQIQNTKYIIWKRTLSALYFISWSKQ